MKRIHSFEDVVGHSWLIPYLKKNLSEHTLPHFIIFDGQEGLGKTTLADLIALRLVYGENIPEQIEDAVIEKKRSTEYIKKYVMSVEGGKDVAKNVVEELNAPLDSTKVKVVICDECQGLSTAAQDVFLSETEYLDKNVYLMMLTTEPQILRPALRSRATPIHLNPLKRSDMMKLLQRECVTRNLKVQGGALTLQMIADWAENKPRTGLSILTAFADDSAISENTVREMIGYLDLDTVLPLLHSLSRSVVNGLTLISEMDVSQSLISIVTEIVKILCDEKSYKVKFADYSRIKAELEGVNIDQIIDFLYGITKESVLTRTLLINAYLHAHKNFKELIDLPSKEVLATENIQRANVELKADKLGSAKVVNVPTLDTLLSNSSIVE